jgi:cellobiose phosphorylase
MKAAFLVGGADKMTEPLLRYCHKRLVCDRVPYAVEAYPEGGKRHLSGESALFVRMVTEGIFGIQPESLDSFSFIAHLPKEFPHLYLEKIKICGGSYDIKIEEDHFFVSCNGKEIAEGKTEGQRVVIRKIEE